MKLKSYQLILLTVLSLIAIICVIQYHNSINLSENQQLIQNLHNKNKQQIPKNDFIKPYTDPNNYEIFVTKNGIKTILVTQDNPQLFGACLSINGVGSFQDYINNQGLSHFLEHLIFTGSKNYTEPLDTFTFEHGGILNGMTASNYTLYPFEMQDEDLLEDVLKRLVDFIVYPGFFKEQVQKEILAVTSEYYIDMVDSSSKIEFLWKILASKSNPFSKFDIGNTDTLSNAVKNTKDTLQKFLETYYVPQNMFLTVTTSTELKNKTKEHIDKIFSVIPEKKSPTFELYKDVFSKDNKGLFIKIKDNSEMNELILNFCLHKYNSDFTKSIDYIQTILAKMGKKQFCSEIVYKKQFATQCEAFYEEITDSEGIFGFILPLTEKGREEIPSIIKLFFSFVHSIQHEAVKKEIYNSVAKLNNLTFFYSEQQDPFTQIMIVNDNFRKMQNTSFLYQASDFQHFDEKEIKQILEEITPENGLFVLRSNSFKQFKMKDLSSEIHEFITENNSYEKSDLYKMQYSIYKLNDKENKKLNNHKIKNLKLDQDIQNQKFLLQMIDLNLIEPLSIPIKQTPSLLESNTKGNLWFYHDASFKEPYDAGMILIDKADAVNSARDELYLRMLSQHFNIQQQDQYSFPTQRGICLFMFFFSGPPFELLLEQLYHKFMRIKPNDFLNDDSYRSFLLQSLKNDLIYQREKGPLAESIQILLSVMTNTHHTNNELLQIINSFSDVDWRDFKRWVLKYQSEFHLEILIGGNIEKAQAVRIYKKILDDAKFIDIPQSEYTEWFIRSLVQTEENQGQKSEEKVTSKKNKNTYAIRKFHSEYDQFNVAVTNYYEMGVLSEKEQYIAKILMPIISGQAFQYLRSDLQLGYVAQAEIVQLGDLFSLIVVIEGYRKDVQEIDRDIEKYLENVYQIIEKMPFNNTAQQQESGCPEGNGKGKRKSILYKCGQKKQGPRIYYSLSNELLDFWEKILSEKYFDQDEDKSSSTSKHFIITKNDLLETYKKWFYKQSGKLSIQMANPFKEDKISDQGLTEKETYCGAKEVVFTEIEPFLNELEGYNKIYMKNKPIIKKN